MALQLLLPVDHSKNSEAAGAVAIQLAAAHGARLTVLRVVNVRPASGNILEDITGHLGFEPAIVSAELAHERDTQARDLVDAWVARAQAQGVEASAVVEVGGVANTILSHAQNADLVVLGVRGETEERFPKQGGEMMAWLPARVDTPILWVTQGASPVTAVALGYDGSEGARHAIRATRALLGALKVPIHAFFITADGTGGEVLNELAQSLPDCAVKPHVVTTASPPHDALVEQSLAVGAQVLVLGFRGKHPLKDFLFGTSTERVLAEGNLAVLVAR